jgi:hypothetical protein
MGLMAELENGSGLSGVEVLTQWSDGGPHFRCNRSLSTVASRAPELLLEAHGLERTREEKNLYTSDQAFGMPAHFKNSVDGDFSYVRSLVDEAARKKPIYTIEDLVQRCRTIDAENIEMRGHAAHDYFFIDYFPKWSKDEMLKWTRRFTPASFKVGIRTSQAFQSKTNDCRRSSQFFGTGARSNTLTALDFRATMLHDNRVSGDYKCLPEVSVSSALDPECEIVDGAEDFQALLTAEAAELFAGEPDAQPELLAGNARASMGEKIVNGWMTSYRTSHPEKMEPTAWAQRFLRQKKKFTEARVPLLAAAMKTCDVRLADKARWAAGKKQRRQIFKEAANANA